MARASLVVLVVDDDTDIAESVADVLAMQRHQVHLAASIAEALQVLRTTTVDVVLSDPEMGAENGADLLRTVGERWPDVFRILFSAAPAPVRQAVLDDGFADFSFGKPFELTDLIHAMTVALRSLRRCMNCCVK